MFTAEIYRTFVNARPVGSEVVVSDFFDFPGPPAIGNTTYRITELPLNVVTPPSLTDPIVVRQVDPITHVYNPFLHTTFTMVTYPAMPMSGQFQIKNPDTFSLGTIVLNNLDGGLTLEIICTGRGSLVYSEDVNGHSAELTQARDNEDSVGNRLDNIENGSRVSIVMSRADYVVGTVSAPYTGSTTVFDLPFTYVPANGHLLVYSGGLLQVIGGAFDYLETSPTQVTFNNPQALGRNITFVWFR